MTADQDRLAPGERRALLAAPVYRVLGTPVVALLGLVNTGIIVRETGEAVFGLVSLVATITLLFPFADLGIGATVLNSSAQLSGPHADSKAANVIRRGYRVLFVVAGGVMVLALMVMALDGWTVLLGFSSGPADRWAITVAACVFALTIPAGLGVRILIGIDRNPLATVVLMSCPAFGLAATLLLYVVDVDGIWYVVSSLTGLLIGLTLGTVLALRLSGLGWTAFAPVAAREDGSRLLSGSGWLFIVGVGLPVGLQTGRVLLAHLSTPSELSDYALMAQLYAVGWSVLSTAGLALWPVFVKRRTAPAQTLRLWWQVTAGFAAAAAVAGLAIALLGPWAAGVLSGGELDVTSALASAFAVLLMVQAVYLPTTVLLTRSSEARRQAWWTVAMAILSVGLGCLVADRFGAVGVVWAAVVGILAAQVLPALLCVPSLVRRRLDAVA